MLGKATLTSNRIESFPAATRTIQNDVRVTGPGRMELFHSDEEYLLVQDLALGARDYFALIQSYLGR